MESKEAAQYFIEKGGWQVLIRIFEWNNQFDLYDCYSYDSEIEIKFMNILSRLTQWIDPIKNDGAHVTMDQVIKMNCDPNNLPT
jgi:hypothetical protein